MSDLLCFRFGRVDNLYNFYLILGVCIANHTWPVRVVSRVLVHKVKKERKKVKSLTEEDKGLFILTYPRCFKLAHMCG